MWLALLKNPLTKLVAEKTIGAVTHKLKKDQIVREREIENAKIQFFDRFRYYFFLLHILFHLYKMLWKEVGRY